MKKKRTVLLFFLANIIVLSYAQAQSAKTGTPQPQTPIAVKGGHADASFETSTTTKGKCETQSVQSDQAKRGEANDKEGYLETKPAPKTSSPETANTSSPR